jgi:hypothetical protein
LSVALPVCSLVFGAVTPPQQDVIELSMHLGQTNEVSSFNCLLQNFDGRYSPGSSDEIKEGVDGRIYIGRGANNPLIAQVRVENVQLWVRRPKTMFASLAEAGVKGSSDAW